MLVRRFDPVGDTAAPAGWFTQHLYPDPSVAHTPFGCAWGILPPGDIGACHSHHEAETFIVVEGRAVARVGKDERTVEAGDVIYVPPFEPHSLSNLGQLHRLVVVKLWWEDSAAPRLPTAPSPAAHGEVLVTATPPTPNGDLHLGHLSGPYLSADVHTRYLRSIGRRARYLSGIDDHQSYVALRAEQLGEDPVDTADRFGAAMVTTLAAADAAPDHLARPRQSHTYEQVVREFFTRLHADGKIVARETPSLRCEAEDRYLFEAYVVGGCPHCGEMTGGNACEDCGRPNDCAELIEPRCRSCGGRASIESSVRLYFPLAPFGEELSRYHQDARMPPHLRVLCEGMIADGLPDICVSHPVPWGTRVPVEGFNDHSIYVWFEMAAGYLAATDELVRRDNPLSGWRDVWCHDDVDVVQFFGYDNGYFHAVLFPALWLAYDPSIRPPRTFVVNEFLLLDGAKFSTSRNHALWGHDILSRYPSDGLRFCLARVSPEIEQTNFTLDLLERTMTDELDNRWRPWLGGLTTVVRERFGGRAPSTGVWTEGQQQFYRGLVELVNEVGRAYAAASFSLQRASVALSRIVGLAARFRAGESHWSHAPGRGAEYRTAVALELAAARAVCVAAAPLLPTFAARLWRELGFAPLDGALPWAPVGALVPPGQHIGELGAALVR